MKNIKLKYQLLLLLALPTLTILYLSAEKLLQNQNQLNRVHHAQAMEQTLSTTAELILELQIERGLSVGFIASQDPRVKNQLQLQRKKSDAKNEKLNQQLSDNIKLFQFKSHTNTWSQLQNRLKRIHNIRSEIDSLKSTPQLSFENYSELIDTILLNIKYRYFESDHETSHIKKQQEHILNLLQLQEYAAQERGLINIVLTSASTPPSLLSRIATVNWMQHRLIAQHDKLTKGERLEKLLTAQHGHTIFSALKATRQSILHKTVKDKLLNKIKLLIDYGNLIHDDKDHFMYRDKSYHLNTLKQYTETIEQFKTYQNANHLSDIERNNLLPIEATLNAYKDRLTHIGESDEQPKIDNIAALSAIKQIEQDVKTISSEEWFQLATQRINIINQHQMELHQQIITQLNQKVLDAQRSSTLTTLFITIILLITSLFSLVIFKRLSVGLSTVAVQMKRAQKDGSLIDESLIGEDELGLMAATLNQLISERKIINTELEQHKNHLESLFEQKSHAYDEQQLILSGIIQTSQDAIITIESSGIITDFNPAAEKIFLYQKSEAVGKNISDLIVPDELREAHKKGLQKATSLPSGQFVGQRYEVPALRADGSSLTIEIAMGRIEIDDAVLFTAFLRDITDRLQHQERLEQAKQQAEVANMAKSEFLANMSHELRTPMHAILSFSEMGLKRYETAPPEKLYRYFDKINISGHRLLKLLNELLDLAKIEANMVSYNFKTHDISHIIHDVLSEYEALIKKHQLRINFAAINFSTCLSIDNEKIERVVNNLLSNAIKFSPQEGEISFLITQHEIISSTGESQPALQLSVKDQGIGIPEDELETIFDKFIQSSKSQTGAGGTGLGLAICKEIIHAHDGKIWAQNNGDGEKGALFSIELPIRRASAK